MLEKIQRTDFEELVAFIKGDTSIARDQETGALLYKYERVYVLIITREPHRCSRWSRSAVRSDEEAIRRAQKVLDRYPL